MQRRQAGFDRRVGKRRRLLSVWAVLFTCLLTPVSLAQARTGALASERAALRETVVVDPGSASARENQAGFARDDSTPLLLTANVSVQDGSGQPAAQPAVSETKQAKSQESQPQEAVKSKPAKTFPRLFETVEFRGMLKNMPKWQRVVTSEQGSRTFDGDLSGLMPGSVHKQWLRLVEQVSDKSDMEKAKAVTAFFNRWPYKTDQAIYKVADYWATPAEFMKNSGDCEDYAITKFYALMKLGVNPDNMRIVALKDTIRNLAHAVLVVYMDNDIYVLDNLTDMVLTHSRYTHYLPQYSINEVYRWAHVRPKKK